MIFRASCLSHRSKQAILQLHSNFSTRSSPTTLFQSSAGSTDATITIKNTTAVDFTHVPKSMPFQKVGNSGLLLSRLSLGFWLTYGGTVGEELARDCMIESLRHVISERKEIHIPFFF